MTTAGKNVVSVQPVICHPTLIVGGGGGGGALTDIRLNHHYLLFIERGCGVFSWLPLITPVCWGSDCHVDT